MSVATIMDALAEQIEDQLGTAIPNLQVENRLHPNPSPPAIDIYPGTPFTEVIAFRGKHQYWFTVRARVLTADNEAGQDLLLAMMDADEDESVETAIRSTRTYAGAKLGNIEGPTEYGLFGDGPEGQILGCTWRVAVIP